MKMKAGLLLFAAVGVLAAVSTAAWPFDLPPTPVYHPPPLFPDWPSTPPPPRDDDPFNFKCVNAVFNSGPSHCTTTWDYDAPKCCAHLTRILIACTGRYKMFSTPDFKAMVDQACNAASAPSSPPHPPY